MHLVLSAVTVLGILASIGFASRARGKWFRLYSFATIAAFIVSFVLLALDVPKVIANGPTPGLGIIERIHLGVYILWVAVLASVLMPAPAAASQSSLKREAMPRAA